MQRVTYNKMKPKHNNGMLVLNRSTNTALVTTVEALTHIQMNSSMQLCKYPGTSTLCRFEVDISADYLVNLQVAIRQTQDIPCFINWYQIGICRGSDHHESRLESTLVDSCSSCDFIICKNIQLMMNLEAGIEYCVWLNFNTRDDNNDKFEYDESMSNLIIKRLM